MLRSRFVPQILLIGLPILCGVADAQLPGTFTLTGNMTVPRFLHTATLLNDGRALITGGSQSSVNPIVPLSTAEIYDPSTGTFTATGDMTTARQSHTATLLPNGKVLIAGGGSATVELYDPSTGTFTATAAMTASGVGLATLLPDGRVLLIEGRNAELYDPSTGTITGAGSMSDLSEAPDYASVLLPNGRALITRTACAMIDGELVYLEPDGTTSFAGRQDAISSRKTNTLTFCAFDLLYREGWDLTGAALEDRKAALAEVIRDVFRDAAGPAHDPADAATTEAPGEAAAGVPSQ